jgi:hypothetical protein
MGSIVDQKKTTGGEGMSQNTSSAVMQQRIEPSDSLDFFPTPAWATRALCEKLGGQAALGDLSCWEPACGQGHMAKPLAEYFRPVYASDIYPYGFGDTQDFLSAKDRHAAWIITNPPFRLAAEFILTGLKASRIGVAVLVRAAFLESIDRYQNLFSKTPPSRILQFAERVPMFKGRLDPRGSTATAYCWVVWQGNPNTTIFDWIAPCRKRLEKPGDYE